MRQKAGWCLTVKAKEFDLYPLVTETIKGTAVEVASQEFLLEE